MTRLWLRYLGQRSLETAPVGGADDRLMPVSASTHADGDRQQALQNGQSNCAVEVQQRVESELPLTLSARIETCMGGLAPRARQPRLLLKGQAGGAVVVLQLFEAGCRQVAPP